MGSAPLRELYWWYDTGYRKWHRLTAIDDFVTVKKFRYRGRPRLLGDGSRIRRGDALLALHFNNRYLAAVQRERGRRSSRQAAMIFGCSIVQSMRHLHEALRDDPDFADVVAVYGITWFKTHGESIGFESYPLPEGWRKTLLRWHFRVLLKIVFPHLAARENQRLEPHEFWLSRRQLASTIVGETSRVAKRLAQYRAPRLADG